MEGLREQLIRFNAKERFHLLNFALDRPKLGTKFLARVNDQTGIAIDPNAWWAMDYHLDWIGAALACTASDHEPPAGWKVTGNQEDVDLIVAWDEADVTQLVLFEAKGVTPFSTKQMQSKVDRLNLIFGELGDHWPEVQCRLVLISPKKSVRLDHTPFSAWLKHASSSEISWMALDIDQVIEMPTRDPSDLSKWSVVRRYPPLDV